ncbi:MAG: ATP phosphoribosyltransferase regulatory subunit [Candidatus Pacearchaeota archaeon]|jgi:histidyl-tRNA synthetase
MITENVKGFRDIEGEEAWKRARIKEILSKKFELYGYELVEAPIVEYEEFVKGNNENDEAVSDIFKLKDRGDRKLALRYEVTFQLKRLSQNKKLPYKRYQIGEVFRDEPISPNRFRQFTQCDIDSVGAGIKSEAETLAVVRDVFEELGIKVTIYVNNRKLLNEILESCGVKDSDKEEVIREIDKMDKLSEKEVMDNLKKYNAEKLVTIFKNKEEYFKKFSSYKEIEELKKYCAYYGVKFVFQPTLARGLSYYIGSVFEVKTDKIKETIVGGGTYMINGSQSTGLSFGLDRITNLANLKEQKRECLIVSLDQDKVSIELSKLIRKNNIPCSVMFGKPSKALEYANTKQISSVVFIGEDEVKSKKYKLKDMISGKEFKVNEKELVKKLS